MFDLVAARYVEPFAMVLAEIAYSGSNNGKLVYRFEHFTQRGRRPSMRRGRRAAR